MWKWETFATHALRERFNSTKRKCGCKEKPTEPIFEAHTNKRLAPLLDANRSMPEGDILFRNPCMQSMRLQNGA